jgi:CHAT domain-containing protein/tetratricopeptide (TPR) repeat protein
VSKLSSGSQPPEDPELAELLAIGDALRADVQTEVHFDRIRAIAGRTDRIGVMAALFHGDYLVGRELFAEAREVFADVLERAGSLGEEHIADLATLRFHGAGAELGRVDEVEQFLQSVEGIDDASVDPYLVGSIERLRATALANRGDFPKAVDALTKACLFFSVADDSVRAWREATAARARCLTIVGRLDDALRDAYACTEAHSGERLDLLHRMLALAVETVNPAATVTITVEVERFPLSASELANVLMTRSWGESYAGNNDDAEATVRRLLALPDVDDRVRRGARFNLIVTLHARHRTLPEEDRAFLLSDEALRINSSPLLVHVQRAHHRLRGGALDAALADLDEAMPHVADVEPTDACNCLALRAAVFDQQGRRAEAVASLEAAEALADRAPPILRAELLYRRAQLEDDLNRAQALYERATDLMRPLEKSALYDLTRVMAMRCALSLDPTNTRAREALSAFLDADDAQTSVHAHALALELRGTLDGRADCFALAAACYCSAGAAAAAVDAWDSASRAALTSGDRPAALLYAREAVKALTALLGACETDDVHVEMQRNALYASAHLASLLLPDEVTAAFQVTLGAKSHALVTLLRARAASAPSVQDEPAKALVAAPRAVLRSEPPSLEGQTMFRRAGSTPPLEADAVNRAYRRLAKIDPKAAKIASELELDTNAILGAIPEAAVGLEYFHVGDALLVFAVTRDSVTCARVAWTDADTGAAAAVEAQLRRGPACTTSRASARVLVSSLRRLHRVLIEPVQDRLAGARRIFVSSGARLGGIPFAALLDRNDVPLIGRHEITALLSLAQLPMLTRPVPSPRRILLGIRGDDVRAGRPKLAHADEELAAVFATAEGRGWEPVRADESWSREEMTFAIQRADVVHYAGHASFVAAAGMAGCLFPPSGAFSAADALGLDLPGLALFVLSGCETGRSSETTGDESVGFLRSLFVGGTRAVLCSTWLADDAATGHVMRDVYRRWFGGTSLSRAFTESARELFATGGPDGAWRHPFYWANFVLYGAL